MNLNKIVLVISIFLISFTTMSWAQDNKDPNATPKKMVLQVNGLSCPFCAYGLEKKLKALEGVQKLDINLNSGLVELYLNQNVSIDSLILKDKISEAGFTLKKILKEPKQEQPEK